MVRSLRLLWGVAVLAAFVAAPGAFAQSVDPAPSTWQPYRDDTGLPSVVGGLGNELGGVEPAQMITSEPMVACPETAIFPQPVFAAPPYDMSYMSQPMAASPSDPAFWHWRLLPDGVIWQSYWAGVHESRTSGVVFNEREGTNFIDVTLGGRASLLRYGTDGPGRPQGGELQIEGAAFPRLNLDENWDLDAVDFRFGLPLIYGRDKWQTKFSYYHLSSHLGDELIEREGSADRRINYSRDALVFALSYYPLPAWRWYAEASWAFYSDFAEPWEFQFGVDIAEPGPTGFAGTPFIAVNGHVREEVDYSGNVVFQAGWLWRGNSTRIMRLGFHYFNGKSSQFEFFDQFEEQIGGGLWYDY